MKKVSNKLSVECQVFIHLTMEVEFQHCPHGRGEMAENKFLNPPKRIRVWF